MSSVWLLDFSSSFNFLTCGIKKKTTRTQKGASLVTLFKVISNLTLSLQNVLTTKHSILDVAE